MEETELVRWCDDRAWAECSGLVTTLNVSIRARIGYSRAFSKCALKTCVRTFANLRGLFIGFWNFPLKSQSCPTSFCNNS